MCVAAGAEVELTLALRLREGEPEARCPAETRGKLRRANGVPDLPVFTLPALETRSSSASRPPGSELPAGFSLMTGWDGTVVVDAATTVGGDEGISRLGIGASFAAFDAPSPAWDRCFCRRGSSGNTSVCSRLSWRATSLPLRGVAGTVGVGGAGAGAGDDEAACRLLCRKMILLTGWCPPSCPFLF